MYKRFIDLFTSRFYFSLVTAGIAGMLMPLSFAPLGWVLLAPGSLAVLFLLIGSRSPMHSFWLGSVFGLGMFGIGVSWVFNSLHEFGSASALVAGVITVGLVIVMAFYIGGMTYSVQRWLHSSVCVQFLCVWPAAWLLMEWLKSWLFTGFPWLLLGYAQVDTALSGYIPMIGVLGAGALVVVTAGCVVLAIIGPAKTRCLSVFLAAILWGVGFLLSGVQWVQPIENTVKASVVQGNIPQEIKLVPENLMVSVNSYFELTEQVKSSDIVIWPETAIPTFLHKAAGFLELLEMQLQSVDADLLLGIFVYDRKDRRYYNSLYKLGDSELIYHKQHLVPFGEYMPFREVLTFLNQFIRIPMSDIATGDPLDKPIELAGYPIGMTICYESAYMSIYRQQLPEANIFVNASNDDWFGDSLAPHQHLEITRARALEFGRPLLRATNTGISAILDHKGKVLKQSSQFQQAVLTYEIQPMRGMTLFAHIGHIPLILLSILILAIIGFKIDKIWIKKIV